MTAACLGIYGKSDSGKTTLIIKIIKRLRKEGFKIATIKITDKNIGMDIEEKDTWMFRKAGSELVVFSSSIETDFLHLKRVETNDILGYIEKFGEYDIVIIEGARNKNIPKIRLGNITKRENTKLTYDGDLQNLIEMIKNEIIRR
jgi:molybdopterin-guanine dinucleotide biosynthesis protein B